MAKTSSASLYWGNPSQSIWRTNSVRYLALCAFASVWLVSVIFIDFAGTVAGARSSSKVIFEVMWIALGIFLVRRSFTLSPGEMVGVTVDEIGLHLTSHQLLPFPSGKVVIKTVNWERIASVDFDESNEIPVVKVKVQSADSSGAPETLPLDFLSGYYFGQTPQGFVAEVRGRIAAG